MNELQIGSADGRQCPQCGAALPGDLPPELCPKCLLKIGLASQAQTGPTGTIIVSGEKHSPGLPQLGERLGHYRIVRSLGSGGMGTVFEAEDLENGRRVALKVLSQKLDSPAARQRFFREGRLAGSINHPNSIYVFGTEEIGGTPIITMELVTGGTIEERVRANGPMSPAGAVDAVLQIIAGLEAAQRTGIVHRDVKPSNCFVDADGTIKIGDFGLSISTAIRMETALTAAGSFLGTPAFCSPEQLRGEELNSRSDMYSLGATLFYLLTGRSPFQAKNDVALIAAILEQPAPSPRQIRPELPRGLSKAVRRCLEKQPGERFKNYGELRKALAPYSSTAPVPATLGLRFLAGMVDMILIGLTTMIIVMVASSRAQQNTFSPFYFMEQMNESPHQALVMTLIANLGFVLYFTLLEGIWGITLGKLVCGLRVVGAANNPPGVWRTLPRPLLCVLAPALPACLYMTILHKVFLGHPVFQNLMGLSYYVLLALVFSTARRRNGFAALHDLVTKTRVVSRTALLARPALAVSETSPPAIEAKPLIGPYHVLDTLADSAGTAWLLGYDLRLLRKVWIRTVPAGTEPVPASLRNLGRVGRLRWLAGRRSPEENWDAFEAVSGQSLLSMLQNPQPWAQVRHWLCDLATELSAAQNDGTTPLLKLDRVWIAGDGRAKLLDFPAPGIPASLADVTSPPAPDKAATVSFLGQIAAAALEGRADSAAKPPSEVSVPLPLHVRQFFKGLPHFADAAALLFALRPLLQRATVVTRLRRAGIVIACLAFPAIAACGLLFGAAFLEQWNHHNPGVFELSQLLQIRSMHRRAENPSNTNQFAPTDFQFAIYIASHYRAEITNSMSWSNTMSFSLINGEARRFAEESLTQHPAPTANEIADADAAIKKIQPRWDTLDMLRKPSFFLFMMVVSLVIYVCLPALIAALAFRGGLVLLLTGVTFVRRDGAPASRLRLFWRALVAWIPILVALVLSFKSLAAPLLPAGSTVGNSPVWALAFGVVCVLTILSIAVPQRGLQDRLAGTWPVLR
jgi:eukaryotic-like serine/threonine-protein kinase